ncbi:hypothetical protein N9283_00225 [Akkermansiaceae bacterium]|nr:hypothetical protein [Akkermansiaceae bacterium]MDB4725078.1 hypothetical protein [Akkermansiaceae bacterium]
MLLLSVALIPKFIRIIIATLWLLIPLAFGPSANPPAEDEIHKIATQRQQAATPRKAA